jgi:hypothetical protein
MRTLTKPRLKKIKKITKQKVWEVFSKCIRLKYADKEGFVICYTCGTKMRWQDSQCGHAIGGRTNSVLFDEEIVRPQCTRCNIFLHGNYTIFTTKLIKEKGMKWWENKLFNSKKIKKFTQSELKELYEHYKEEVEKLLEKLEVKG